MQVAQSNNQDLPPSAYIMDGIMRVYDYDAPKVNSATCRACGHTGPLLECTTQPIHGGIAARCPDCRGVVAYVHDFRPAPSEA